MRSPEKLMLSGNLKESFRKFKQQIAIYITEAQWNKLENRRRSMSTLFHINGLDAVEFFQHIQMG